jgi:hypothetical protein
MSSGSTANDPVIGSRVEKTPYTLPVAHDLKVITLVSLLIALLTAGASATGLLYQDQIYPNDALREAFVANDVVNLVLGLPILLGSMWLARRGRLVGLLFWPGALFYAFYNYLVYLLGLPFNVMYVAALVIVTLSLYATIGLVAGLDGPAVEARLKGFVPEKLAGAILVIFGLLFMMLAASGLAGALASGDAIAAPDLALQSTDFLVCFAWIIGGVMLWRRDALGYVSGTGLLFQASMLFIGLLAVLLLQPLLGAASLAIGDIVTVALMSLVSFIPLGLFLRGVRRSEASGR